MISANRSMKTYWNTEMIGFVARPRIVLEEVYGMP